MNLYDNIKSLCDKAREASRSLSVKSGKERNNALLKMADFSLLDIYPYFLSYKPYIREKQMGRVAIRCLSKGEFCFDN